MELTIEKVKKRYNHNIALKEVSMQLTPGVYGLLGPNGAGKSTLINIMTDNIQPDEGEVRFNSDSITKLGSKYRSKVGYMPQQQGLYEDFTGNRFLWYMASLKGMKKAEAKRKIDQLINIVNLKDVANKKLGSYSGGMKQRILIAQALINDPEVLILDEPTAGLDPKERISIRNFISTIASNKIVLIATHVVSDIEYIAKEIIVMKKGEILLKDEPADLLDAMQGKVAEVKIHEDQLEFIGQKYVISNIAREKNDYLTVRVIGDELSDEIDKVVVKPNLEDLYLYHFH